MYKLRVPLLCSGTCAISRISLLMVFSGSLDADVVQVDLLDPETQRRGSCAQGVLVARRVRKEWFLKCGGIENRSRFAPSKNVSPATEIRSRCRTAATPASSGSRGRSSHFYPSRSSRTSRCCGENREESHSTFEE